MSGDEASGAGALLVEEELACCCCWWPDADANAAKASSPLLEPMLWIRLKVCVLLSELGDDGIRKRSLNRLKITCDAKDYNENGANLTHLRIASGRPNSIIFHEARSAV